MALLDTIARLRSQLLTSGLQKRDNPLFQVINQLIGLVQSVGRENEASINIVDTALKNATYITAVSEIATLPNSRVLTAGTDIAIDNTVAGISTVNFTGSSGGGSEWSVLTNGEEDNPELVFAGGDVIMTHIP